MRKPDPYDDLNWYRPSRYELDRLAKIEVSYAADGAIEMTDTSLAKWAPTEQQESFLENLLEDEDCKLSISDAIQATGGTMKDVRRWCRREPEFMALFKARVKEQFEVAEVGADLTVAGAAAGILTPTYHVRWGIEKMMSIRDFLHRSEIRFLTINQQFNLGPQADQDDEALMRVVNAGNEIAAKSITQIIEGR